MSLRSSSTPPECASCHAPLRADQRYCLDCGARVAPPRVEPLAALGFAEAAEPAAPAGAGTPRAVDAAARRRPSPRLSAALAAATLVAGGVVGAALGPAPEPSSATAPPQRLVALVVDGAAPATTASTATQETAATEPDDAGGESATPAAADAGADAGADASAADDPSTSTDADTTTTAPAEDESDDDASTPAPAGTTVPSATVPSAIAPAHVWLIALPPGTDPGAFAAGGAYADLAAQGTVLSNYAGAAPSAAANAVALLGGQVPAADCDADVAACVLGAGETSLPDQLTSVNLVWKAYVEDPALRCAATPSPLVATSLFTTLRQRPDCTTTTVGTDRLAADLATAGATPAFSLIVPADPVASLHALVAQITASAAYKDGGVLVLAADTPPPGALVLSPRATAGATAGAATGPVALLRSLDALLGLDPLATAAQAPAGALDGVLTTSTPSTSTPSTTSTTRRSP